MAASTRTSTPASDTALISLLFGPLADPPVTGKSRGGVAVGGMVVGRTAVGGTAVVRTDLWAGVAVGGTDVAVGGMDVAVGGTDVAVGVNPADTGATCPAMAPMTNRIKIPVKISLGATDSLLCFHDVLQLARFLPGLSI